MGVEVAIFMTSISALTSNDCKHHYDNHFNHNYYSHIHFIITSVIINIVIAIIIVVIIIIILIIIILIIINIIITVTVIIIILFAFIPKRPPRPAAILTQEDEDGVLPSVGLLVGDVQGEAHARPAVEVAEVVEAGERERCQQAHAHPHARHDAAHDTRLQHVEGELDRDEAVDGDDCRGTDWGL